MFFGGKKTYRAIATTHEGGLVGIPGNFHWAKHNGNEDFRFFAK